jgi:hypothetical protein
MAPEETLEKALKKTRQRLTIDFCNRIGYLLKIQKNIAMNMKTHG